MPSRSRRWASRSWLVTPLVALALTSGAIVAVWGLVGRGHSSRVAQLQTESMKPSLADLGNAPFNADPLAGGSPAASHALIVADETSISRGLSADAQHGVAPSVLRQGRSELAALAPTVTAIFRIASGGGGPGGAGDRMPRLQGRLVARSRSLSRVLERIGADDDARAGHVAEQVKFGTAGAMLLLLAAFAFFYLRSVRARQAVLQALREKRRLVVDAQLAASQTAAILDSSAEAIIRLDRCGRIRFINPAARTMLGIVGDAAIGRPWTAVAGLRPSAQEHLDNTLRLSLEHRQQEGELKDAQGRAFPVQLSMSPIRVEGEASDGLVLTFADISERRAAEREARRSRHHLANAQAAAGGASWEWELATGATLWSGIAGTMHNLAPTTSPSLQAMLSTLAAEDRVAHEHAADACLRTGTAVDLEYHVLANQHGRQRIVHAHISRVENADGRPIGLLGSCQDITDRAQREAAERATRAKNDFMSRMSHELRTPLNAILGFGQILQMQDLRATDAANVGRIVTAGRHLLALIDEVLDISRIEAGELKLKLEPLALDAVVREAQTIIDPMRRERGLSLDVAFEHGDLRIRADRQRLRQALLNLLSNAVKYNHDGGNVTIVTRADGAGVQIDVHDDGPGIAPEMLPRLFVPFDRLQADGSTVEGTGLGLAVTKALIEAMGGRLAVDSDLGRGTTFSIHLPQASDVRGADRGAADAHAADSQAVCGATASDRRHGAGVPVVAAAGARVVLCIEDNAANAALVGAVLGADPTVELLCATGGFGGLRMARTRRPDVVLLEMGLADLPGAEVLSRMKTDRTTAGIPVIVLSCTPSDEEEHEAMALGAFAYLPKPLDLGEFYAAFASCAPAPSLGRIAGQLG